MNIKKGNKKIGSLEVSSLRNNGTPESSRDMVYRNQTFEKAVLKMIHKNWQKQGMTWDNEMKENLSLRQARADKA